MGPGASRFRGISGGLRDELQVRPIGLRGFGGLSARSPDGSQRRELSRLGLLSLAEHFPRSWPDLHQRTCLISISVLGAI